MRFFFPAVLVNEASGAGGTWTACSGSVDVFNEKWGYFVSPGYSGNYGTYYGCWFYFNLRNSDYETVYFKVRYYQYFFKPNH